MDGGMKDGMEEWRAGWRNEGMDGGMKGWMEEWRVGWMEE